LNRQYALAGWDPLGWVHDMSWYREMLRAEWFKSIKPYWIRYHLDWVVAGLLILAIVLIVRAFFKRRRVKLTFREKDKNPLEAARKFSKMGEVRLAAECYAQAGEYKKAKRLYEKEEDWSQAAQMSENLGQVEEAAKLYKKANDPQGALRVYRQAGLLEEAEEIFREMDNLSEAAEMYLEAERPTTAAALYREAGLLARAAEILHSAGEDLQAAECLLDLSAQSSGGFTKEEADQFIRAAKTYKQKGQPANSARMLEAIREYGEAARRYLKAGERKRAARCYEAAGDLEKAAELYRDLEDQEATIRLLERMRRQGGGVGQGEYARALKSAGQFERAADAYQAAGDLEAAVAANIEGDQPGGAAALLAEQGRHHEAARLYLEAGDPAQAREQFLLAHDRRGAATAGLAAGMCFEAGVDFVDLGQWGRAVEALQQVEDSHPRYREASSLLGQAFARLGERQMAWSMHQRAVKGLEIQRDNLELFYQMARFLEESQEISERTRAQKLYSEIMTVNYTFRDAKARHDRLA